MMPILSVVARVPVAQGKYATGSPAKNTATISITNVPVEASQVSGPTSKGTIGVRTTATIPITVTGATKGPANRLAIIEYVGRPSCNCSSKGKQSSCAEAVTASPRAKGLGILVANLSLSAGASNKIPAVARRESPKPNSKESHGSAISRTTAAIAKAFSAHVLLPRQSMSITLAVMTAALRTLGSGPTRRT